MIDWMKSSRTVVLLSSISLLLMLERIFLDFRYVAVEMEAPQAYMPFTAPYMIGAFLIIGGWVWALLTAVQGSRLALIPLLAFNALGVVFAVSTVAVLCPTPCQTAAPITDILVYLQLVISLAAIVSVGLRWASARPVRAIRS